MYSKNFVSISFSAKKIAFLQLNPAKKQVVKYGSVDIPEGIIFNYKVTDSKALSKVIADAYKKLGLKEKSVGLIIPEFSTYTRTLLLPILENKEIDEAVRWQMKEFLPENSEEEMIMDWKLLKKIAGQQQVLAVAIPKQVLSGYVEAVSEADLFPLVVETPSLSLVRVQSSEDVKIIIYGNAGEAIIIVASGQQIIGTVVAPSSDQDALSRLALQISRHYSETPPVKIILAGTQISQSLVAQVTKDLNLPTEWVKLTMIGLGVSETQEYIIPLSMQLKDPTEPADETSVNLLPPHWAQTYKDKRFKIQIWSLVLISTIVVWSLLLGIIGANLVLNNQSNSIKNQQKVANEAPLELITQVNKLNKTAESVEKIFSSVKSPQEIANILFSSKSEGLNITKIDLNLEEGKVIILGIAKDRKSLIDFKQTLESKEEFGPISIPISALELESNIQFNLEFAYLFALPKSTGNVKLKL